jgi:surface protein
MMTFRAKRAFDLIALLFLLTGLSIGPAQAAPSDHFVTTWKTDNPGQSNNTSITVPMEGGPYDVDWDNDGTFDEFWLTGPVTHDFGVAGTYTIRIGGSYSSIRFENAGDKDKIVSLDQWGTQAWTTMFRAFDGCSNIEVPATDTPDFSAVTSMTSMFDGAASANPDTSGWDTSSVKFMSYMFYGATSANPDTSGWDTSSVQYLHYMFYGATSANPDTSGWDTSSVRDMQ